MTKWTKKKLITNSIILIAALICAVILFFITENPGFFSASVISLQDAQDMKTNKRDIWYKNESNTLDVFVSDDLQDISNITVSIIYDPNNATLNTEKITTQSSLLTDIISDDPWLLVLKFSDFTGGFDYKNSLFELPFSASEDIYNAILSEAVVVSINWENKPLSIWLLNNWWNSYH